MKKGMIIIALALILAVGILPVAGQTTHTGHTMMIGGLVPLILNLEITQHTQAQDLPLLGEGSHEQVIATIEISTNNSAGWELWAYSENGSQLRNSFFDPGPGGEPTHANNFIPYTIRYDGGDVYSIIPEGSGFGGPGDGTTEGGDPEAPFSGRIIASDVGQASDGILEIIYVQSNDYRAGYYSDIISIVLRAQ